MFCLLRMAACFEQYFFYFRNNIALRARENEVMRAMFRVHMLYVQAVATQSLLMNPCPAPPPP